jgi:hypothetical protein
VKLVSVMLGVRTKLPVWKVISKYNNLPNSVNTKALSYVNTEPSRDVKSQACVTTLQEIPNKGKDKVWTCRKDKINNTNVALREINCVPYK